MKAKDTTTTHMTVCTAILGQNHGSLEVNGGKIRTQATL